VQKLDVTYRTDAGRSFATQHLAPEQAGLGPLPKHATRVEYTLVLRDAQGNALYRRGTKQAPDVLALTPRDYGIEGPGSERPASPAGYYLTAGLLAGAGLAATGAGVYFTVRREHYAEEWNGSSCEQPGSARGEQCADVDDHRQTAQSLAIGFYAGGGALLVGSLVTLLLAPSGAPAESRRAALPCVPGVAPLGAACTLNF
jgi:hypothetical protein